MPISKHAENDEPDKAERTNKRRRGNNGCRLLKPLRHP
jgi:hypothetical protein